MARNFPTLAVIAGIVSLLLTTTAYAQQCSCAGGTRMTANEIQELLPGKTVCAVIGNNKNTMWQEYHDGSSVVELGNSTAGDVVGSWTVTGGNAAPQSTITYNYGSGGSYIYEMCSQNGVYHFCGATNVTNATVNSGITKCY